jgi:AraC-like DNA-binding protein
VLPLERARPVVRFAHRVSGWLTIPERLITDHELVLLLRGRGEFELRDRVIALGPHQLLVIPPFLPHVFRCRPVVEHIAVHFDLAPDVPRFPRRGDRRPSYEVRLAPDLELRLHRVLPAGGEVEQQLMALERAWSSGTPAGRLAAHGHLAVVVAALAAPRDPAARAPSAVAEDARLRQALALMRERLAEPVTMGDCARAAGMSPTRFAHRFRDHTGYAPMEWLRRLRVERARQLLADPEPTIKEVAARCGFVDPYHFSRVFRLLDGLSPTQYRAAAIAGRGRAPV